MTRIFFSLEHHGVVEFEKNFIYTSPLPLRIDNSTTPSFFYFKRTKEVTFHHHFTNIFHIFLSHSY